MSVGGQKKEQTPIRGSYLYPFIKLSRKVYSGIFFLFQRHLSLHLRHCSGPGKANRGSISCCFQFVDGAIEPIGDKPPVQLVAAHADRKLSGTV